MSEAQRGLLVVAGHDPSFGPDGGAGVDADREAAGRFGLPIVCVVSAWTDQHAGSVRSIGARSPASWLAEARAALRPRPLALKAGLLPGAEHVRAFATLVRELGEERERPPVVVDPVFAASGGEPFLDAVGRAVLLDELLPLSVVLTPNLPEAALALGLAPEALAEREARLRAARELLGRGARAVVLKGGHAADDPVADLVLERGAEPRWCEHPRVPGPGLHGSGCRFATALAALLARGDALPDAALAAGRWLAERIEAVQRSRGG